MKIRELSFKNCLSFSDKGLNAKGSVQLAEFNLLVGRNNSGKSNVLRLVDLTKSIVASISEAGDWRMQNAPLQRTEVTEDFLFHCDKKRQIEFSFLLEIEERDNIKLSVPRHDQNPSVVAFMLELTGGWPKLLRITGFVQHHQQVGLSTTVTRVEMPNKHTYYSKEPVLFDREAKKVLALRPGGWESPDDMVWKLVQHRSDNEWMAGFQIIGTDVLTFLRQLYDSLFRESLVKISAIRSISPLGDEIVESLSRLKEGTPEQIDLHDSVVTCIKRLTNECVSRWTIPPVFSLRTSSAKSSYLRPS